VAIGLPERLEQVRGKTARRLFAQAFSRLDTIVAYGWGEVEELRSWLGEDGPRIEFVPFGVDVDHFRPDSSAVLVDDVVSIGADPRRDYALVVELARRLPNLVFRIVGSSDNVRALGSMPANLTMEIDVPFERVRERLLGAKLVALPVRENTYSGATTTLLQAMACAKPVVVTRTAAIARGYHLEDGVNCSLVPPGDLAALEQAVRGLLDDPGRASDLGARARDTVETHLTWSAYTGALGRLLTAAAERGADGR
jgi:glycosyltransferase involved in cell wall biosynthesis